MYPILFRIGNHPIRSYTILIDLGLLAGLGLAYWLWRRRDFPPIAFLDAAVCALAGSVIGGRAAYVFAHWAYFQDHLSETIAIWTGGMSFHGAFLGGCLGLIAYAGISRRPFWGMADIFSAGMALGGIFGWLACLAGGCAYGVVGNGFLFLVSPNIYGIEAPRFAVQAVSIVQCAVILAILLLLITRRARPGAALASFLFLYFGGQAALELVRGDESVLIGSWSLRLIADVAFAAAGVLVFIFARARRGSTPDQEPIAPAEAIS